MGCVRCVRCPLLLPRQLRSESRAVWLARHIGPGRFFLGQHRSHRVAVFPDQWTNFMTGVPRCRFPAPLSRVLDSRGITGAARETFLSPASWSQMEAPKSLPGMIAARDRILRAIRGKQPTLIYGDYDADGVLSSSILATTLRMLGADVSVVLPRRDEGYGLSVATVKRFAGESKRLVITVDNGISALEPIRLADRLGLDAFAAK